MLRQAEAHFALRRVGLEQPALDQHGFEVAPRHVFTAQEQVVQWAQCLRAHALLEHRGLKHQAGFDARLDGIEIQQARHEADLVQTGVQHVIGPGK
ncbi:MAG: hypothetical protein A3F78_05455 [Burkholderiales bacterium RIFCSPLOWO2_12_FULL_61_40]|nr:MAG: hypothetical protein A3F78_05455 [Burkholderiales bacterium RIFCSPLOWO2_12_FULL_61_40]